MSSIDNHAVCECLRTAVTTILRETVELQVASHEIREETQPVMMEDGVTTIVGVTGDLEGSFALSMREDFAVRYASRLLEMDITAYDEVVASAIGEFGNMVIAQTTMGLLDIGLQCDLCPPTILRSSGAELRGPHSSLLSLEIQSDWGHMVGRIFLRERVGSQAPRPESRP